MLDCVSEKGMNTNFLHVCDEPLYKLDTWMLDTNFRNQTIF